MRPKSLGTSGPPHLPLVKAWGVCLWGGTLAWRVVRGQQSSDQGSNTATHKAPLHGPQKPIASPHPQGPLTPAAGYWGCKAALWTRGT